MSLPDAVGPTRPSRHLVSVPPNPVQVEIDLINFINELEDKSIEYHQVCREVANTEADYKYAFHQALVSLMFEKSTEKIKLAKAELTTATEHRAWLVAQQNQKSSYAYIQYLHKAIDALRTIAANYRKQG